MTIGQQLFSIFYAVLYGVMLTSLSNLQAFPWGFCAAPTDRLRLACRLVVSILLFNAAPFLLFAAGFGMLSGCSDNDIGFWQVFTIALAALSVYSPYRLYHLLIVGLQDSRFALYTELEYDEITEKRNIRKARLGHVFAFVVYGYLIVLLDSIC